jgi:precorrin-6Y C5,15-methyltransferase (decarboxylating)
MTKVLLFAGTTEGREIAEGCRGKDIDLIVSVATAYGETLIEPADNVHVISGRKDADGMAALIRDTGAELIVDATHPYAAEVTRTLKAVADQAGVEYLRVLRGEDHEALAGCVLVDDTPGAVAYLNGTEGPVLLTVGSKELFQYTAVTDWQNRLYARVLPLPASTEIAFGLGFTGSHLICMQGPFSQEINEAMLRMLDCRYLVTKDTGAAGGFAEKIRAARACGVTPIVIRRPMAESGIGVAECLQLLGERCGWPATAKKHITILGVGMGDPGTLTKAAEEACRAADLIVGAQRVTDALTRFGKPAQNAVAAKDIEAILRAAPAEHIVVAMSGDTGFYSGTRGLLPRIGDMEVTVLPGISSIAYFAAKAGTSWDDALLLSAHGRACNYVTKIRRSTKTMVLVGGDRGVTDLLTALIDNGLGHLPVTVGENLSYPNEKITRGAAGELAAGTFAPLSLVLVENPDAHSAVLIQGRPDGDFLRTEVPMTKSEVRAVTLSKLRLTRDALCWDVGAGTGSVSLEMAEAAEDGQVYAIERKKEACALIEENKRHLGVTNVTVIEGAAPDALRDLPAPTHVFVGGSGGELKEILALVLEKNPAARIVVNTVTAETFAAALDAVKALPVRDVEIVELSVSRGRKVGGYHLMTAQNPVYLFSCQGGQENG